MQILRLLFVVMVIVIPAIFSGCAKKDSPSAITKNASDATADALFAIIEDNQKKHPSLVYEVQTDWTEFVKMDSYEEAKKFAIQKQEEIYKKRNLPLPDFTEKDWKNLLETKVQELLNGLNKTNDLTYKYVIHDINNYVTYQFCETYNEITWINGRYNNFQAYFTPVSKYYDDISNSLRYSDNSQYKRFEIPLFAYEAILGHKTDYHKITSSKSGSISSVTATWNDDKIQGNKQYSIVFDNSRNIVKQFMITYLDLDTKEKLLETVFTYNDFVKWNDKFFYPTTIIKTHSGIKRKKFTPWFCDIHRISMIEFKDVSISELNFKIPVNTKINSNMSMGLKGELCSTLHENDLFSLTNKIYGIDPKY
jgi:hypothetical protein